MNALGNRFYVGIPGTTLDSATRQVLKKIHPGGIILFGRNIKSPKQFAHLTHSIRSLLGSETLICIDHEGGRVNRLKDLIGVVPSAMQLGYLGETSLARKHGNLTGRLLMEFGININLAPVLDLHLRPKTDNSVPDRCWSVKPNEVVRLAGAFIHGMQQEGVMGCGKHFLGYGAANKDPHLFLPEVTRTMREILKEDLVPYAKLLPPKKFEMGSKKNNLAPHLHLIMLSHAHLNAFHGKKLNTPACISPKVAKDLLRNKLKFRGVSITDDLEMGAITRLMSIGEGTVKCMAQGADLILICHTFKAILDGYHTAQKAVKTGRLSPDLLEESQNRIVTLQNRIKVKKTFSERRYQTLLKDIHQFTKKVFKAVPPPLRVIDSRWGAIGEKY